MVTILLERMEGTTDIPLPETATRGSSGVDLRAAVPCDTVLQPGGTALVPTGLRVAIPAGYEWQIRPRSGNALRHRVTVLNTPGTVDSDYRGEVMVILANLGSESFLVKRGDRIAQAVLSPVVHPDFVVVDRLDDTERGAGGFGHTGCR
jgi:dUTP pyrophosphatase